MTVLPAARNPLERGVTLIVIVVALPDPQYSGVPASAGGVTVVATDTAAPATVRVWAIGN